MNKTITLLGLVFALSPLAATAETLWVHGSWVNVRETAEAQSAVIEHVTTNTPVEVAARHNEGKTCEIGWGEAKRGFVPCRLLGERALTLKETGRGQASNLASYRAQNPQFSPVRAFWIAPSVSALREAGWYFQQTLLSEKQFNVEFGGDWGNNNEDKPPPKLVRYPVPEFEAMKTLLAEGIVAAAYWDLPLLSCQQIREAKARRTGKSGEDNTDWPQRKLLETYYPDHDYTILDGTRYFWNKWMPLIEDCQGPDKSLRLPKISPSFFKSAKDILPGNAHIEQISAHFGIVERGRVISGPRWGCTGGDHMECSWHYAGAWDIGRYELKLDKPIVEHVIGENGLVGAYQWTPQQQFDFDLEATLVGGECMWELSTWQPGKGNLLPGYAAIKKALLWFQSPVALPLQKAKITRHTHNGGNDQDRVYEIVVDLDNDGIADFVKWSSGVNFNEDGYGHSIIFININGEWHPFEQDRAEQCGC